MTKKILLVALALIMILLLAVGCAKSPEEKAIEAMEEAFEDMVDGEMDMEALEDLGEELEAIESSDDSDSGASTDLTPAASYERFLDAKADAYDSLAEKLDENMELSMTAGLELLAMAMVDLQAIDILFITDDKAETEAVAMMMGYADVDVDYSGDNFSISYNWSDGSKSKSNGMYDKKTDSLTCTWTIDGKETMMLEYVRYGEGYAGQYFIIDEDGSLSVIKIIADGQDIAVGMGKVDAKPTSIYNAAPSDYSFVEGNASVFIIKDGQGTSTMDGVEKLF